MPRLDHLDHRSRLPLERKFVVLANDARLMLSVNRANLHSEAPSVRTARGSTSSHALNSTAQFVDDPFYALRASRRGGPGIFLFLGDAFGDQ
jgi:hypothetical protein